MASTSTRPGSFSPKAAQTADASDRAAFYERWLRVWVAIISIVVVVVVVFLIFISDALASIDGNLGVTTSEVTNVGGNAKTLPGQIASVNGSLDQIYQDLAPADGDAVAIIANLNSIEGDLAPTSSSLVSTTDLLNTISGQLVTVSGSLAGTEGVLNSVESLASNINTSLDNTWDAAGNCAGSPVNLGVYTPTPGSTSVIQFSCAPNQNSAINIIQRVEFADNLLNAANSNLTTISAGLTKVDGHLSSICNALVLNVLHTVGGGTC